jgi:hypothetical protein
MSVSNSISFAYWLLEGRVFQVLSHIPSLHYERKSCGRKPILSIEEGTCVLKEGVNGDKPFLAGRFGSSECNAAVQFFRMQNGLRKSFGDHLDVMTNNAGFFPKDEELLKEYCHLAIDLYKELDLLCIMNSVAEGFIIQEYCKNASLTRLPVVDPLRTEWTSVLAGKKVLVVHPLAETIEYQYNNARKSLFPNTSILPEFDLQTIKAIQTIAGEKDERFSTWFEALDFMTDKALSKEYDVALVGCGAYGLPLAARIKRNGKKAVHMGGCLQLLFGIRGARWDARPEYLSFVNDSWIRPSMFDVPKCSKNVEDGCYW